MGSTEQIRANRGRLDSWKAIAQYLGRDVRSVQRWERERGLPVHRLPGQKGSAVFAFEDELDQWLRSRQQDAPSSAIPAVSADPVPDIPPSAPEIPQTPAPAFHSSHTRWLVSAGILMLLLAGSAFTWKRLVAATDQPIRSIAVLPLQNLSSDTNQEYFADGMTDELITDLAQVRELKVVSKTSVMSYKGTHKPLPQIGRELGVDAVVEGSILRSGDQVRITAQLIRAASDRHLWAQAYEGDLRNALALQARVAEAITDEVRLNLSAEERGRFHSSRSYDPEAYDLYLRGRYAFQRRTEQAFYEAINYFKQAAAKDPEFPLAYAGLSDCDSLLALNGEGYSWVAEANGDARKALSLDGTLAEAHTSLAAAEVLDWKWAEAEEEFRRALDLNPNNAQAHQWYGNLLLGPLGRNQEAIAELQRALELDPLSLIVNTDLGYAYYLAGDDDSAYHQYQKVLAIDSSFIPVHYDLKLYYEHRGMYDQEIQELIADYRLTGNFAGADIIRQLSRDPHKFFEAMVAAGGPMGPPTGDKGSFATSVTAYVQSGKKPEALVALQKAYERREPYMLFIKADPTLASLHNEPAFQELERKVGLLPQ